MDCCKVGKVTENNTQGGEINKNNCGLFHMYAMVFRMMSTL